MKKIRHNVFETNSSSTHSICIAKDVEVELPESIKFIQGEFGWEYDTLGTNNKKASYLYTAFNYVDRQEDFKKIVAVLESKGVEVIIEEDEFDGYIDHIYDLEEMLDGLLENEDQLLSYLFSDLSFIITGNDNSDNDVEIKVDYPFTEYYKGN